MNPTPGHNNCPNFHYLSLLLLPCNSPTSGFCSVPFHSVLFYLIRRSPFRRLSRQICLTATPVSSPWISAVNSCRDTNNPNSSRRPTSADFFTYKHTNELCHRLPVHQCHDHPARNPEWLHDYCPLSETRRGPESFTIRSGTQSHCEHETVHHLLLPSPAPAPFVNTFVAHDFHPLSWIVS